MSKLRGEALYKAALVRLKSGETEVVDTSAPDFRFSTTTVAIEAGKKKGFIRTKRYPELCREIIAEEDARKSKLADSPKKAKNTADARVKKLNEQYASLKRDHEVCLEQMLNLIRSNYELQRENQHLKALNNNVTEISSRRQ
ncbi:hypothetical protein [Halomonas sp. KRD171]|uniref:hypothetical protein n=1 Tax=Halomonas sp. KRD171 TaxID=2729726 RepID=UPI0019D0B3BA|nr:hypothetical protein [Halomonas sp. KRD171]